MMKKFTPHVIIVGAVLVFALSMYDMVSEGRKLLPNPDPNHTHADLAVWVNGTELDFSAPEYMSAKPQTSALPLLIDRALAHGDDEDPSTMIPARRYLHFHDGNGFVVHKHKPGLTLGDFFVSLGLKMTASCLTLDEHQFESLDQAWVKDFAITKNLCNNGKFHWTMVVNGKVVPMNPNYDFQDLDQILLTYSAGDDYSAEWKQMTSDACRYSLRCPWKGTPPKENCISDPTVPCVQ